MADKPIQEPSAKNQPGQEIKSFSKQDCQAALPKGFSSRAREEYQGKRRRQRLAGQILCFLVVLAGLTFIWSGFFLPQRGEKQIAGSFQRGLEASQAQAELQATPWRILQGQTDALRLNLEFPADSPLHLTRLEAVWLSSPEIMAEVKAGRGGLAENTPDELTLFWDEAAFGSYLQHRLGEISGMNFSPQIEIKGQELVIQGAVELLGALRQVKLTLEPAIIQGELGFTKIELDAEGESLRHLLAEDGYQNFRLPLHIPKLGWVFQGESLELEEGGLRILAQGQRP